MGLDQAIRVMTPEMAAKLGPWQAAGSPELEEVQSWPEQYGVIEDVWKGRKENHIRLAIERVTGIEAINCGYVFLTKEDMNALVNRLRMVAEDPDKAGVLLPTQSGFFFGNTDYDEMYFEKIERELPLFETILDEWDESKVYAYWEWW